MAWVITLTSYMIFQERTLSMESMYFLKILLSLSGAVMLATLPGFFDIGYNVGGLTIRAAGGAAAFVFIYTQSPHVPVFKNTIAPHTPAPVMRNGQHSSNGGYDGDSLPLLVALSLDPSSFSASAVADAAKMDASGGDTGIIVAGQSGGSLSGVSSVLSGIAMTAQTVLGRMAHNAQYLLDRAATALRAAVSWIGARVTDLAGGLRSLTVPSGSEIQAFVASIPEKAEDALNAALSPAVSAVEQLTVRLEADVPLLGTVSDATGTLTKTVGDTLSFATSTVGDFAVGLLRSPKDAVALTGKAVGDLTDGLADTTHDVLAATGTITKGVNAQISALTGKLNEVTPGLVARINPDVAAAGAAKSSLLEVTSALPSLSHLGGADGVKIPVLGPVTDRFAANNLHESGEIRSGCVSCVLPPLDLRGVAGGLAGAEGSRGGPLSVLGLGGGGSGGAGGGAAAGGGLLGGGGGGLLGGAGSGGAGSEGGGGGGGLGGAVSSTVGAVGSTVGRTTRGLLGKR